MFTSFEIGETLEMIQKEHLDVRTITMGISLLDCMSGDSKKCADNVYDKICKKADNLVKTGEDIEKQLGVPIINNRNSVTPISIMAAA